MSMYPKNMFFTSESVAEGHPDKFLHPSVPTQTPVYRSARTLRSLHRRVFCSGRVDSKSTRH